jgi:hypothetical protein
VVEPKAMNERPRSTNKVVTSVLSLKGSFKKSRLNNAEKIGIDASINTTFATVVFEIAKTKAGAVEPISTA